jgi:small subunit ribosomal protein S4
MVKKPRRPGMHGAKRERQPSEMKTQLQEKQRLRLTYGLRESAMHRVVHEAMRTKGNTAEILMSLLERRIDNVVYRLGFASSRSIARQLVGHGHVCVNGRKVTIPSYRVRPGEVVSIRPESKDHSLLKELRERLAKAQAPVWLTLDAENAKGSITTAPKDIEAPFDISLIVDYYSK